MLESKSQVVELKRWTAKRKASLVVDILKGKTTLAEASREFESVSTTGGGLECCPNCDKSLCLPSTTEPRPRRPILGEGIP